MRIEILGASEDKREYHALVTEGKINWNNLQVGDILYTSSWTSLPLGDLRIVGKTNNEVILTVVLFI